ncbi:MAG: sterol desaturase family protein [Ginsengibacter sp.]
MLAKQIKKEIKWSLVTTAIFALTANFTLLLWEKGYTKIYNDLRPYDVLYVPACLMLLIVIHETYYYWLHRWMHLPAIFKVVHKVHHESKTTSPFTAFSFHPIESALQAVFFPVVVLVFPIHYMVLGTLLIFMTITSMINHLNIEIYPKNFNKNIIGRWFIGATHHALHHSEFKVNYGLYLTFWDKIKRTESKNYHPLFDAITTRKKTV